MNDARKSAITKLGKLGLTEEEVLSLFEDDEETIVTEDGESSGNESKSWQQLVMEEHVGYYNKRYDTDLTFEEYYEGVTSGKIEVHYNWKQMLGLEKPAVIPPNPNHKNEKFRKHGN
jgi:hypothetical protein